MKTELLYPIPDDLMNNIEIADEFFESLRKIDSLIRVKVIKGAQMLVVSSDMHIHDDIQFVIQHGIRMLSMASRANALSNRIQTT